MPNAPEKAEPGSPRVMTTAAPSSASAMPTQPSALRRSPKKSVAPTATAIGLSAMISAARPALIVSNAAKKQ